MKNQDSIISDEINEYNIDMKNKLLSFIEESIDDYDFMEPDISLRNLLIGINDSWKPDDFEHWSEQYHEEMKESTKDSFKDWDKLIWINPPRSNK